MSTMSKTTDSSETSAQARERRRAVALKGWATRRARIEEALDDVGVAEDPDEELHATQAVDEERALARLRRRKAKEQGLPPPEQMRFDALDVIELYEAPISPVCTFCVYRLTIFSRKQRHCLAYPHTKTIPADIWEGKDLHMKSRGDEEDGQYYFDLHFHAPLDVVERHNPQLAAEWSEREKRERVYGGQHISFS